jgi:hypothetical protein
MAHVTNYNLDQKFDFTAALKKSIFIFGAIGAVLLVIGILFAMFGSDHGTHEAAGHAVETTGEHAQESAGHVTEADGHAVEETGGHGYHWSERFFANLWINNVYFAGISIIGVFFFAIQYASQAGWSTGLLRIFLSFGTWLPYAAVLMLITFFIAGHDIFHWTHSYVYDSSNPDTYDPIIDGKGSYFYWPLEKGTFPFFFILRLVVFFGLWIFFFKKMQNLSQQEDLNGGNSYWYAIRKWSAIFLIVFAVSSSVGPWDWIMSIDTHWFSTLFGWYIFSSWFVAGLAAMTLVAIFLKERGYLEMVNVNHIHDMGKYVFAFSIFWTYLWFSQYLLIYYANIPEESVYYVERQHSETYGMFFYLNLVFNFVLPFFVLMTRDSKRHWIFLKVVCCLIIFGHWMDIFMTVQPGMLGHNGGIGFMEIGMLLLYAAIVGFVVLTGLSKQKLVAKNHPMLEESYHHHI